VSLLVNPTFWALCAALVVILVSADPRTSLARAVRTASSTTMLVLVTAGVLLNVGARAVLGHTVPGDFVQEIVGTRQLSTGETLYPSDVNGAARTALKESPPPRVPWLPAPVVRWLERREQQGRNLLVAQAHPPTLLVAAAGGMRLLGPYGAYWALVALSAGAALLTALLLTRVLVAGAAARVHVLAGLLLLGWQPVLATIRDGQVSVIVGALVIVGWWLLRSGRTGGGGAAVGAAVALKLYPLLLIVPLARWSRRAALTTAAGTLVLAGAAAAVAGPAAWGQYSHAARLVSEAFATAPHNLSLLARVGTVATGPVQHAVFLILATAAVAGTLTLGRRNAGAHEGRALDRTFAAFVVLALLLSPVAWHHSVFMLALPIAILAADAWYKGRRRHMAAVCVLALILSVPDDAWRMAWWHLPRPLALLASPGVAAVALWAGLLRSCAELARMPVTAAAPAGCR
jgi:hypothetical protein